MSALSPKEIHDGLIDVKHGRYDLETARTIANTVINNIIRISDDFCFKTKDGTNSEAQKILNKVQYEIMKLAIANEVRYIINEKTNCPS